MPVGPSAALAAEYSEKADAYARFWSPVIKPMGLPLLGALPLADARRILDAGSGTGAYLPELRAAAPHAALIAIDRAHGMLRSRSVPAVPAAVMDAGTLALLPAAFDVAVAIFMLFHLPDPVRGIAELRRVVRPGGVVGIATWGNEPPQPGILLWNEELDRVGAPADPRDPSVMQRDAMNTPDRLRALTDAGGFASAEIWSHACEHRWTPDALIAVQTSCGLPMRRMAAMPAGTRRACEERIRRALEGFSAEELTYRPEVLFCVAR